MAYNLSKKLVVAVASSALFDLKESDEVFRTQGENAYRQYQRENETNVLAQGVAFPLIKRLLALNDAESQPIEVVLFSRNVPDTGLRVFNSIAHYGLDISRAVFVAGKNPYKYLEAFNAALFLSGNKEDVKEAIEHGLPAGFVNQTDYEDDESDKELRMAFDFDAVLVDDASEKVYQEKGLERYKEHELKHGNVPMNEGRYMILLFEFPKFSRQNWKKKNKIQITKQKFVLLSVPLEMHRLTNGS